MAGSLVIDTLRDGAGNSTSATNAIRGSAKAWVSFVGSSGAINASYNVSSVTRTAVGNYSINFTNALTDANYAMGSASQYVTTASYYPVPTVFASGSTNTSSVAYIQTVLGGTAYDCSFVTAAFFR